MDDRPKGAPVLRPPTVADLKASLSCGLRDFAAAPLHGLFFATVFVVTGLAMAWITWTTGTTFWLILAVLGFPLIGSFAALGFYEISRRRAAGQPLKLGPIVGLLWLHRTGQLPWLAVIIVVVFLFWFFLGHMIFALFLGLAPMTNVSSSLGVFLTPDGLIMLAFGSAVGAVFAALVFGISVLGIPMLLDRDVDFITAMLSSLSAVLTAPAIYVGWGIFIALTTLLAMAPAFLGLFLIMPVLGHATWHLYVRVRAVETKSTPGAASET